TKYETRPMKTPPVFFQPPNSLHIITLTGYPTLCTQGIPTLQTTPKDQKHAQTERDDLYNFPQCSSICFNGGSADLWSLCSVFIARICTRDNEALHIQYQVP
ncbi:hypothetical protein F2P56_007829, partial [Juglans regia]